MELSDFAKQLPPDGLWVFGYGSLMWSPGFRALEQTPARVHGYHRSLCILSYQHRGSRARPGLVVGLQRGGSCWGMAFRVSPVRARFVLRALWRREMTYRVYQPRVLSARLRTGRTVRALAFTADPTHPQYAGDLGIARMAEAVAHSSGSRGRNIDYLRRTLAHMRQLGVPDPHLERVLARADRLAREHAADRIAHAKERNARAAR